MLSLIVALSTASVLGERTQSPPIKIVAQKLRCLHQYITSRIKFGYYFDCLLIKIQALKFLLPFPSYEINYCRTAETNTLSSACLWLEENQPRFRLVEIARERLSSELTLHWACIRSKSLIPPNS